MFQQRPFIVRAILACLLAFGGLFTVSRLSLGATLPLSPAAASNRATAITPTGSLELSPDNGVFVNTPVNLPGVQNGFAIWGDCNNDGGQDVLLAGQLSSTFEIASVYQRQVTGFSQAAALLDVVYGAAAWGDFDNDGWLDVVLTGENSGIPVSRLYRNTRSGCTFDAVSANLVGVRHSAVAWGDYNTDGQLDLLVAGDDGAQPVTKIYRNQYGSFSDSGLVLPGIQNGAAAWGDYDNDGWADLLLTGSTDGGAPLTALYHNDGHGALIEVSTTLPNLGNSAAAWGDYNNDGDLDILLEGAQGVSAYIAEIYRNDQGTFVKNDDVTLFGSTSWTSAAWGDYDTDGYLDALVTTSGFARAYRNEITGTFAAGVDIGSPLQYGTVAWGDYEDTGNLDVLLTGQDLVGTQLTKIYRYDILPSSAQPNPPQDLTATVVGSSIVLSWSPPSSDDHTPLTGLSYNLRVGTQPGGADIIAPMAASTGYRLLPALGNVYQARSVTLTNLAVGQKYYWGVQAIDTSFLGSNFAEEGSFQIPHRVYLPVALKDFINYYTNEGEAEPNNTYLQANGPLESGRVYRGVHNDERDYYGVYLPAGGTIDVDLISSNGGTQIQLFYQIADIAHRVGADISAPYHIGYSGAAGWYYIYVYTNPAFTGTDVYTLTVTYP